MYNLSSPSTTVDPSCCFHVLPLRPVWSGSRTFSSVDTTNGFGIGTSDDLRSRMKWCFVIIFGLSLLLFLLSLLFEGILGGSGNLCLLSSLALTISLAEAAAAAHPDATPDPIELSLAPAVTEIGKAKSSSTTAAAAAAADAVTTLLCFSIFGRCFDTALTQSLHGYWMHPSFLPSVLSSAQPPFRS